MIKKKITLVVCVFGTALFFVLAFSRELGVCPSYSYSSCANISNNLAETILPIFPALLLLLATYWMREEIYQAWFRFARWWVPVIIGITFLLGNMSGGGTLGMDKDFTIFICLFWFFYIRNSKVAQLCSENTATTCTCKNIIRKLVRTIVVTLFYSKRSNYFIRQTK